MRTFLLHLPLLALLAAPSACTVKADATPVNTDRSEDAVPARAVEVGKEFNFDGELRAAGPAYSLERVFTFSVAEETDVRARSTGTAAFCDDDQDIAGPVFLIATAAGGDKRASSATDGYTTVDPLEFPGKLPTGDYHLTVVYTAPARCTLAWSYVMLERREIVKPVPKPEPKPEGNELQGFWLSDVAGFVRDELRVGPTGAITQKIWVQGALFLDIEASGAIDAAASPKRALMTVTKVNYADPQAEVVIGTANYCIYELGSAGAALKMACDEAYPTAFDDESSQYAKQP